MREFLLGLYLEHGERDFTYRSVYGTMFHKSYPEFIELIKRPKYDAQLCRGMMEGYITSSPYSDGYKLTPKGLEYLKNA